MTHTQKEMIKQASKLKLNGVHPSQIKIYLREIFWSDRRWLYGNDYYNWTLRFKKVNKLVNEIV